MSRSGAIKLSALKVPFGLGKEKNDDRFGIKLSLITHVGLLLFVVFKSLIFPGKAIRYIPALRVDMIGLPDVLKKDLSKLSKIPAPPDIEKALKDAEEKPKEKLAPPSKEKAAPKADDEVGLKKKVEAREKKMKSALERMKALAKVTEDDAPKKASAIVKGNLKSKGAALSPDAKESMESGYLDQLRDKMLENWALPVWLARQKLDAQVLLFIDGKGRVKGLKFTKSSGNPKFDEEVRHAIGASQPFPTPPEEIGDSLLTNGILIGFPL